MEILVIDAPEIEDVDPANETFVISIHVDPVNDPPAVHLFAVNGTSLLSPDPTEPALV